MEELYCKNCETPLKETYKFCPNCGQKTTDDLTLGVLFYNTISNYFSFDARFLKSFLPLMFRPGYLAKKFIEGKRLSYLHPASMYLFVSVIFFFLSSFVITDLEVEADKLNKKIAEAPVVNEINDKLKTTLDSLQKQAKKNGVEFQQDEALVEATESISDSTSTTEYTKGSIDWGFNKKIIDSLIASGAKESEIYKAMGMSDDANSLERGAYSSFLRLAKGQGAGSILRRAFDAVPIAMFILLPLFALILKIFYYKRGRYTYHLVFSFYFFSFLFALFSILLGIHRFIVEIPTWISWLIVLSTYFYFSLLSFYRRNWFFTIIKSVIITFFFLSFMIPTALSILIAFGFISTTA